MPRQNADVFLPVGQALVRAIRSVQSVPRVVEFSLTDGDGGSDAPVSEIIDVKLSERRRVSPT